MRQAERVPVEKSLREGVGKNHNPLNLGSKALLSIKPDHIT